MARDTRLLGLVLSGKAQHTVIVFKDMKTARGAGNGFALFKSAEEIAGDFRKVTVEDIMEMRNKIVPPKDRWSSTNDIKTRVEGAWQLWADAMDILPVTEEVETVMAKKAEVKAKKATKGAEEPKERKQRANDYEGKTIFAASNYDELPSLREGSTRHEAMASVLAGGKKGIKVDTWLSKGEPCGVSMLTKLIGWGRVEVR